MTRWRANFGSSESRKASNLKWLQFQRERTAMSKLPGFPDSGFTNNLTRDDNDAKKSSAAAYLVLVVIVCVFFSAAIGCSIGSWKRQERKKDDSESAGTT